jgi:hypothetical protein
MLRNHRSLLAALIFVLVFAVSYVVLAQIMPRLVVTNTAAFVVDTNNNQLADPGDVIRYTAQIDNCGDEAARDVHYRSEIDTNTSLLPGSVAVSGLQPAAGCPPSGEVSQPQPAPQPPPPAQADAIAADDVVNVTNGGTSNQDIVANDSGESPLVVVSFGDTQATVGTFPADDVTVGSFPAGGGTLDVTIDANGNLSVTSVGTTGSGSITIFYQLQAGNGTTDIGQITVNFGDFPTAVDDTYTTPAGTALNVPADGVLTNDTLGAPAAVLTLFGGGDASAAMNNAAGSTVNFAGGGSLTVSADGSFDFTPGAFVGVFTFQYTIDNGIGGVTATVTINVEQLPTAADDTFTVALGAVDTSNDVTANDDLGAPPATVTGYADVGDIGGGSNVASPGIYTVPGSGGITVSVATDGMLTVDTTAGTATAGTYSFDYQIDNGIGTSVATVTLDVVAQPVANNDALTLNVGTTDATLNILANDNLGVPPADLIDYGTAGTRGTTLGSPFTIPGSGGVTVTITVAGDVTVDAPGGAQAGVYQVEYLLQNPQGSDTAIIEVTVRQGPVANDDAFTVTSGSSLTPGAGALFADNGSGADVLGVPSADVVSFGDGDLGGDVTGNAAGAAVTLGTDGSLQVNADGSFSFTPPTTPTRLCGDFSFQYRLENAAGFDDATVTVAVQCGPIAEDDTFTGGFTSGPGGLTLTGDLFADNGSGTDFLGIPAGAISSFGGGSLGGDVTTNTAGASVALANGTLTVNVDGSFTLADITTPGTYTFQYRLSSALPAFDDATVTIEVDAPPTVTSTLPLNGATGVPPASTITITFSEDVDIVAGGITLECPVGTAIPFTPTTAAAVGSITITPTGGLPGNTTCTVTLVSANITDTDTNDPPDNLDGSGDGLEGGDYVFSFETAPEAVDDAYNVNPHLTFNSPTSVTANDNPSTVTVTGFGPTAVTTTAVPDGSNMITAGGAGGTVRMNADGTFTYFPPPNVKDGTATFFYQITGGDTAQVTLTIPNEPLIWFVNAAYGGANGVSDGTQARPFTSLTGAGSFDAVASDNVDDYIYIAQGSYTCGLTLLAIATFLKYGINKERGYREVRWDAKIAQSACSRECARRSDHRQTGTQSPCTNGCYPTRAHDHSQLAGSANRRDCQAVRLPSANRA